MLKVILSSLGLVGGIILVSAYWPQIVKLFKIKKSEEFSLLTWASWFFGNALLLIYAISIKDLVYITLESISTFALGFVFVLIIVYRKNKK